MYTSAITLCATDVTGFQILLSNCRISDHPHVNCFPLVCIRPPKVREDKVSPPPVGQPKITVLLHFPTTDEYHGDPPWNITSFSIELQPAWLFADDRNKEITF